MVGPKLPGQKIVDCHFPSKVDLPRTAQYTIWHLFLSCCPVVLISIEKALGYVSMFLHFLRVDTSLVEQD